tara:strand:+ start:63135 stop:63464 length:330 start_codon:yes stop_codon:yes gene_type:complete
MLERIKFMKVNKNKRFEYTPRFYDERKERLQKMKEAYNDDGNPEDLQRRERMRDNMKTSWGLESAHTRQSRAANIRLVIILAALLLGSYFILDYVEIFTAEVTNIEPTK